MCMRSNHHMLSEPKKELISMPESDVFNRQVTNSKLISPTMYNVTIGEYLLWGFS
ncbi:MAG: hypothetical protein CENE_01835 [Candidatus Celerinatantimonas neptuna]|nr:MAG: hypothetical protein CENE_01835 [Candidatus Celerinatantimonas neptuna]